MLNKFQIIGNLTNFYVNFMSSFKLYFVEKKDTLLFVCIGRFFNWIDILLCYTLLEINSFLHEV